MTGFLLGMSRIESLVSCQNVYLTRNESRSNDTFVISVSICVKVFGEGSYVTYSLKLFDVYLRNQGRPRTNVLRSDERILVKVL